MTFDARHSIDAGFIHLAARLDPIITNRLAAVLGGLPWTAVLEQLDVAKGKAPGHYIASDPQAQLRVLTERLGAVGFPFDDKARSVSTLGSELRIVRNQLSHFDELGTLDAIRMHDFAHRLLSRLADPKGAQAAATARDEAMGAYAREQGLAAAPAAALPAPTAELAAPLFYGTEVPADAGSTDGAAAAPVVSPDASVLIRETGAATPMVGAERTAFQPWSVVIVGAVDVLDDLPKKRAKEKVRAVAAEIAEFEGPIHIDRLASLTAASFGLRRLAAKRRLQLVRHIKATGLRVSPRGFVWPTGLDHETWTEFRPNDSTVDRPFTQISPVEIANAMRVIEDSSPSMSADEIDYAVLRTFGKSRRTASIVAHLAVARSLMRSPTGSCPPTSLR
ncbi:DUF3320 domain-containing protein [Xylanimonas sp. McL0601]|uniref:DUF3320 domain-containing protein n=1 Tax=Xylanimonas sp. McL0601 TaxID=3414739 RepID=UPI003CEB6E12